MPKQTFITKRAPRPYLSPPHLKITPPDGGGYPPDDDDEKEIKPQEGKKMLDKILNRISENEEEPIGTEVKEVPKCKKGMHW